MRCCRYNLTRGEAYESKAMQGNTILFSIGILLLYVLVLAGFLVLNDWKLNPRCRAAAHASRPRAHVGFSRLAPLRLGGALIAMHLLFIAWTLLSNPIGAGATPLIQLPGWEESA